MSVLICTCIYTCICHYLIVNLGVVDGCAMYMYMYIDMKLGGGRRHIDFGQVKKHLFDECVYQSPWYC